MQLEIVTEHISPEKVNVCGMGQGPRTHLFLRRLLSTNFQDFLVSGDQDPTLQRESFTSDMQKRLLVVLSGEVTVSATWQLTWKRLLREISPEITVSRILPLADPVNTSHHIDPLIQDQPRLPGHSDEPS